MFVNTKTNVACRMSDSDCWVVYFRKLPFDEKFGLRRVKSKSIFLQSSRRKSVAEHPGGGWYL